MKPYDVAGWEKSLLTKQAQKDVTKIYKESADEVEKLLENFKIVNPSDKLRKLYLEDLKTQISGVYSQASQGIYQDIVQNSLKSAKLAVDGHVKTMNGVGFNIGGAFSHIPRQEVQRIIGGKIYDGSWSLSKAIWRAEQKTNQDINYILAKGLAENRTIEELSNDLMTFVRPDAVKPWEWKKVYPNIGKSIEYNSQRLARTMIQHSFQASMVRAERKNPFCEGIRWHSAEIHGRTCDLCRDRDGQVFTVRNLPYDHPNGLCWYEPELEDLDKISDRLAKWANGEEDGNIDAYIKDAFGLDPKSLLVNRSAHVKPVTKKTTKKTVEKTVPKTPTQTTKEIVKNPKSAAKGLQPIKDKAAYIDKNFKNLKQVVFNCTSNVEDAEWYWEELREFMIGFDSDYLRYIQHGQSSLKNIELMPENQACYVPWENTIRIDLGEDIRARRRTKLNVFFHEYGHHMDEIFKDNGYPVFSADYEFRTTVWDLLHAEAEDNIFSKGTMKVRPEVRADLIKNKETSSTVQDLISGLTQDQERIRYGHSADYWNESPTSYLCIEFMAHCSTAWSDPVHAEYMEKYFPRAYKYFRDTVEKQMAKLGV